MARKEIVSVEDLVLNELVEELVKIHNCHTVILYGSRARGDATNKSDFDLMGVRKSGKNYRVAKKQNSFFVDIFVFAEKDLKKVDESFLYMNGGKVICEHKKIGTKFIKKLKKVAKKKFKPRPIDEIEVRRVWLHKMLDRTTVRDVEGNYRRSWLHEALLYEYFSIRKKRFWGSKQSFDWLRENDITTFRLFEKVLSKPLDNFFLKKLVERVSGLKM